MAYLKTAEARTAKRGNTAFFGEPDALLPGHGIRVQILKKHCFSFLLKRLRRPLNKKGRGFMKTAPGLCSREFFC
jgi:hypothetical protein